MSIVLKTISLILRVIIAGVFAVSFEQPYNWLGLCCTLGLAAVDAIELGDKIREEQEMRAQMKPKRRKRTTRKRNDDGPLWIGKLVWFIFLNGITALALFILKSNGVPIELPLIVGIHVSISLLSLVL